MRTLLFSAYDAALAPLGQLTAPLLLSYAHRHGFDYHCYRSPLSDIKHGIYWTGVLGALSAFQQGYERVLYLDADQVITNPAWAPPWVSGFHASRDWGVDALDDSCFSMCGFVACADVRDLLTAVWESAPDWVDKPFPEQGPMQYAYRTFAWAKAHMFIHIRSIFNSVPIEVHESVVDPWEPGRFTAHLTMLPVAERVQLFHKIQSRLNDERQT